MHFQFLSFLLVTQLLSACQNGAESPLPLAASSLSTPEILDVQVHLEPTSDIIFQSIDGGQSWQDVSAGLPKFEWIGNILVDDNEVYLATEKNIYRSNRNQATPQWEIFFSLNGIISGLYTGKAGVYVCNWGDGIYQNVRGTDIWKPISNRPEATRVRTLFENEDGTLLMGTDDGIFKSKDGGQNWKHVLQQGMVLNIVAAGGVMMAGGTHGVLRSTNGGDSWENVLDENIMAKKTGLLNAQFVAILGTEDAKKVCPEGITSRLRISKDQGKTWHRPEQSLLPLQGVYDMDARLSQEKDLHDIIQSGQYFFCSFESGIFRSADQGKTWEPVLSADDQWTYYMAVSKKAVYALRGRSGC